MIFREGILNTALAALIHLNRALYGPKSDITRPRRALSPVCHHQFVFHGRRLVRNDFMCHHVIVMVRIAYRRWGNAERDENAGAVDCGLAGAHVCCRVLIERETAGAGRNGGPSSNIKCDKNKIMTQIRSAFGDCRNRIYPEIMLIAYL
jgi:hypothetical protein